MDSPLSNLEPQIQTSNKNKNLSGRTNVLIISNLISICVDLIWCTIQLSSLESLIEP